MTSGVEFEVDTAGPRVTSVASQCRSWTRVLLRGTSRSTIRRTAEAELSEDAQAGALMFGGLAVSRLYVKPNHPLEFGSKHTRTRNKLSCRRNSVVAKLRSKGYSNRYRKARSSLRARNAQRGSEDENSFAEHVV